MHNIDRTQQVMMDDDLSDTEFEGDWDPDGDDSDEDLVAGVPANGPLSDAEEMELAAELLQVEDDEELEQVIQKTVDKAGRRRGRRAKPRRRRGLGKFLGNLAKKALPVVGAAVGNIVAPGIGGAIGSKLASGAGKAFGLELEGLSPEDQEFEAARRFVRLAGAAGDEAAKIPASVPDAAATKVAVKKAVKRHAPALVRKVSRAAGAGAGAAGVGRDEGRWIRQGRKIVLLGV